MRPRFYKVAKGFCRFFTRIIFPYRVENGNSIPDGFACVVCSNHISNLDPVFLNITQSRLLHFMAKQELFKNKFFAGLISRLGAFPVNRGSDGGKAINKAGELLSSGECIGIFIEGTRSKTGKLGRGHMGALMIARDAGVPVVPCCITPKKTFVKPFRRTKITFGEPLTMEQLGIVSDDNRQLRDGTRLLMEKIGEMRERHLEEFASKGKKK